MIATLVAVLVLMALATVWLGRRRTHRRDEMRRVGDESAVHPHEAALRAQGRTVWTRLGGGGSSGFGS